MKVKVIKAWEYGKPQPDTSKIDTFIEWCSKYFIPEKKPKTKKKLDTYCKYFATCDLECTNYKPLKQAFCYAWAFCFRGRVFVGRDLQSYLYFMGKLSDTLGEMHLIIYWHNYSYDWAFVSGVYKFSASECFFTNPRKILYANMFGNLNNRCSYLLSGLSLRNFTKQMNVKHIKLSGEKYDYSRVRTSYSGMKKYELRYLINDVRGLLEALEKFFKAENDTVYTIPYTKTGFVRRDIKKACNKISYKRRLDWGLSYEAFVVCQEAFRGGNTHTSRFYANEGTILSNISSNDFCSSYPSVMLLSSHFPKRGFQHTGALTEEQYNDFIFNRGMCGVFRIRMEDVKLKNPTWACPYLPLAKVRKVRKPILDNGRILACDSCEISVTDIDIYILQFEYNFKMEIYDSFVCKAGPLPDEIKEVIFKYYKNKTELKGVTSEDGSIESFYMNQKGALNSTYGNMVMNSCQRILEYHDDKQEFKYSKKVKIDGEEKEIENEEELNRIILEKYNKKGLPSFAVGVFVTALARLELEKVMSKLPNFSFVYADTDSLKYINCDHSIFDEYNKEVIEKCEKMGMYAFTQKGEKKYLQVFEFEEQYKKFTSLGAKKYAYIDQEDKLHLTCAGVGKVKGAKELEENGGLSAFKLGFVFRKGGGVCATYNDTYSGLLELDGHKIPLTKNIYLEESTYTVGQEVNHQVIARIAFKYIMDGSLDIENEYNDWYNVFTD